MVLSTVGTETHSEYIDSVVAFLWILKNQSNLSFSIIPPLSSLITDPVTGQVTSTKAYDVLEKNFIIANYNSLGRYVFPHTLDILHFYCNVHVSNISFFISLSFPLFHF